MIQSSTLKHLWNILMFRQMMNEVCKEILDVCKAMPRAKPCPLTLWYLNSVASKGNKFFSLRAKAHLEGGGAN